MNRITNLSFPLDFRRSRVMRNNEMIIIVHRPKIAINKLHIFQAT